MPTAAEIQSKIETIDRALLSKHTPESSKEKLNALRVTFSNDLALIKNADAIKVDIKKEETKLSTVPPAEKPAVIKKINAHKQQVKNKTGIVKKSVKQASAALKSILSKKPADVKKFNAGRSEKALVSDSHRSGLKPGKRTSKSGHTYYEKRPDRSDINQKLHLEKGGKVESDDYRYCIVAYKMKVNGEWKTMFHQKLEPTTNKETMNIYVEHVTADKKNAAKFHDFQEAQKIGDLFASPMQIPSVKTYMAGGGGIDMYDDMEAQFPGVKAATDKLKAYLEEKGISIQSVDEASFETDASINITDEISVQVSLDCEYSVNKWDGKVMGFYDCSKDMQKVYTTVKNLLDGKEVEGMAKGGRIKSALMRDRKYISHEEWEKRYFRKTPGHHYDSMADGGPVKRLSKKEKTALLLTAMLLKSYQSTLPDSTVGYNTITKTIEGFTTDPRDKGNINMAILLLGEYQTTLSDPKKMDTVAIAISELKAIFINSPRNVSLQTFVESNVSKILSHYLPGVEITEVNTSPEVRKAGDYFIDKDTVSDGSQRVFVEACFGDKFESTEKLLNENYVQETKFLDDLVKNTSFNTDVLSNESNKAIVFTFTKIKTGYKDGGAIDNSWYDQAVTYLQDTYGLEPNDIDLTTETQHEEADGETPQEYVDRIAEKNDFTRLDSPYGFEDGGLIPTSYKGIDSAADLWSIWSQRQRHHFLVDHSRQLNYEQSAILSKEKFDQLPIHVKQLVDIHRMTGRYGSGGAIPVPQWFGTGKNIEVFGYETENFDISALGVERILNIIPSIIDVKTKGKVYSIAKHVDHFFGIEKNIIKNQTISKEQFIDMTKDIIFIEILNNQLPFNNINFDFLLTDLYQIAGYINNKVSELYDTLQSNSTMLLRCYHRLSDADGEPVEEDKGIEPQPLAEFLTELRNESIKTLKIINKANSMAGGGAVTTTERPAPTEYEDPYSGEKVYGWISSWNKGMLDGKETPVVYYVANDDHFMVCSALLKNGKLINGSEAWDDWFANEQDALEVAYELSQDQGYGSEGYEKGGILKNAVTIAKDKDSLVVVCQSISKFDEQNEFLPVSTPTFVPVKSLKEASKACRKYIDDNDLGMSNWKGGKVFNKKGEQVAWVSYNGRIWEKQPSSDIPKEISHEEAEKEYYKTPAPVVEKPLQKEKGGPVKKSFGPEIGKFIASEKNETKPYTYRAKILWGTEVVLKEDEHHTPVSKIAIGDWKDAVQVAEILNKNAKKPAKKEMLKGGTISADTPIIPEIIAYDVALDQYAKKYGLPRTTAQIKKADIIFPKLTSHLVKKANSMYKTSEAFKTTMNKPGNVGRDQLKSFMKTWSVEYLNKK